MGGVTSVSVRIFGVISYASFHASFLYYAALLTGLVAGHRPGASPAQSIAIDLALLGFFAVTHSVMARPAFKQWSTRWIPPAAERSLYVLVASLQIGLLCWQWRPIGETAVWSTSGWLADTLVALQLVGFGIAFASTFLIDHFELFGLRQAFGRPAAAPGFRTPWLYRFVRHPLYLGLVIALWAAPAPGLARLLLAAGLTVYVLVGARLEERDLVHRFGDDYRRYQRDVPMILPH